MNVISLICGILAIIVGMGILGRLLPVPSYFSIGLSYIALGLSFLGNIKGTLDK